jgi:excisionase family DNA binding protein
MPNDKLLTRKEAADFLGTAENTLAVWACNKRYNLPMIKIGKLVRYKKSDLIAFVEKYNTSN